MLKLKRLDLSDVQELYHLVEVSRSELTNLFWAATATLESTHRFVEYKLAVGSHDLLLGIFEDGVMAGVIEFRTLPDRVQIGYWLGTPFRGRGIMHAAVQLACDSWYPFMFRGEPLTAQLRPENSKSRSILEAAGFREVGREPRGTDGTEGEWVLFKREQLV